AIPSYAAANSDLLVDVRAGAQAVVLVGMSRLRREETPEGLEAALAALGRRRAGQGIPLPDVLLAFQVGAHRFWQHIVELAPESPDERLDVLYDVTRTMLELLETAVASVSAGYQETAEEIVADEEHALQALIEVLSGVRRARRAVRGGGASRGGARRARRRKAGLRRGVVGRGAGRHSRRGAPAFADRVLRVGAFVGRRGAQLVRTPPHSGVPPQQDRDAA